MKIFIGYDSRQPVAFQVLAHSIYSRASKPVSITPLILSQLLITRRGLTEFTFSRYLVPYLCNYRGHALFLDADMLVFGDICEIAEIVSAHEQINPLEDMANVYLVKNRRRFEWPSLIYFNNKECRSLTVDEIEHGNPQSLDWAENIGSLPSNWNHIVGYDEPRKDAKLVHFTQGLPMFPETKDCEYSKEWNDEARKSMSSVPWIDIMGKSVHRDAVLFKTNKDK